MSKEPDSQLQEMSIPNNPKRFWLRRSVKLTILCLLLVFSFGAGAVLTLGFVLPLAMVGGLVSFAAAGATQLQGILVAGPSEQRLEILKYLSAQYDDANAPMMDDSALKFFQPGLESCLIDNDPEVVTLAQGLLDRISIESTHEVSTEVTTEVTTE